MEKYILMLCILLGITSLSYSQDKKYYYAYDEKINLSEVENKVLIGCGAKYFSATKNALSTDTKVKKTEWKNDSICVVIIESPQYKSFKEYFLRQEGIKFVQPLYITDEGSESIVTDEIVVLFKKDVSQEEIDELHKKYHVTVKKITSLYQLLSVPVNEDALDVANAYQLSGLVEFSHPNFISKVELYQIPPDPYFVNQFYLRNTGQTMPNGHSGTSGTDIRVTEAWDITKGSSDIVVAVIDEGVSPYHPDLSYTRQVVLAGSNFGDGNPNEPFPTGNDSHGNACAGIIAASHNIEGIAGIAPNCNIMPIRIFNSDGTGVSDESLAAAINFARINGAHIISNSWGLSKANPNTSPVIKNAIDTAITYGRNGKGCVVVFATGNSADHADGAYGVVYFPSNVQLAGVLAVGASDRDDIQANYSPTSSYGSSYHQIVDVVAPSHRAYSWQIAGETGEVWTIDISENAGYNPVHHTDGGALPIVGSTMPSSGINYLSYTGCFGGTSAACPQVAGIAALILSINPNLTQLQVANIIEGTARKAGNYVYQTRPSLPNGTWSAEMGYGVLNAYAAVQAACASLDIINQTITTNTTVTACSNLNIRNVRIQNNSKLTVNVPGTTYIEGPFSIREGSQFEVNN
jgi:subtilisin family serine protease